jgi:hypothetical protein
MSEITDLPQAGLLCNSCKKVFRGEVWNYEDDFIPPGEHHSPPGLRHAALDGCVLCGMLVASEEFKERSLQYDSSEPTYAGLRREGEEYPLSLFFWFDSRDARRGAPLLFFRLLTPNGAAILFLVLVHFSNVCIEASTMQPEILGSDSSSTSSSKSIGKAEKWLGTCLSSHSSCFKPSNDSHRLPIRLLEIDPDCSSKVDSIRLREDIYASRYLTLSHCWGSGGQNVLRLLQDNIEDFKQMIPIAALSKTFRDAVSCVQRLNVRYLWIDSLCIIQDSKEDWLRQSSLMSEIYSRSLLNLAATSSSNGEGGLFRLRDPATINCCYIEPQIPNHEIQSYFCVHPRSWKWSVRDSILSTRAWVFQEMALAPRTLHFTSDQIFWHCNELRASEIYTAGLPAEPNHEDPEDFLARDLSMDSDLYRWARIVNDYTNKKLTHESKDRLIALSGVAREVANQNGFTENDYLAGIWRRMLPWGLLWDAEVGTRHFLHNSAPSWSWASISGPISFPRPPYSVPDIRVIQSSTISNTDSFGQVDGGAIILEGQIIKCDISRNQDFRCGWSIGRPGEEHAFCHVTAVVDDDNLRDHQINILIAYIVPMYGPPKAETDKGLVLIRVPDRKGTFRRFGLFYATVSNDQTSQFLAKSEPLDIDDYLAHDGNRYRIAIV